MNRFKVETLMTRLLNVRILTGPCGIPASPRQMGLAHSPAVAGSSVPGQVTGPSQGKRNILTVLTSRSLMKIHQLCKVSTLVVE